MTLCKCAQ